MSFGTICKFTTFFREIIADHLMDRQAINKIGGVGMTVEIDESMFGKRFKNRLIDFLDLIKHFRKYNRGRVAGRRQCWVLGGVCRETSK